MKKINSIGMIGAALFANIAIAENPFDVHFDSAVPFMEDSKTLIFDGMRVEGAGLSADNDALRVKFNFDFNTLNFNLNRDDIKIYSNIGVFNEEHMAIDVSVSQPNYVANGVTYRFNETHNFEATSSKPFVAELNLQAGHVISSLINNPSNDFSYELTGENLDTKFLGEGSQGVISDAYKILANGVYRLKIIPRNSLTLTFSLKLYNGNNMLLREIANNERISGSFEKNIRDYAKYKVTLGAGDTLTLSKSPLNIRLKLVDSLGKEVAAVSGLALIYKAEKPEVYYLFIDNKNGHGGSYSSNISIESSSLARSKKRNTYRTYDKASPAMP